MTRWSEEEEATLRRLWLEGKEVRDIAKAVGRSINAVWEKASALNLPARGSVKRTTVRHDRYATSTLPPLPSEVNND